MPRQNRVTPFGELLATPERGTLFGNRGVLHDDHGHIRRAWQLERWIVCVLQFKGRRRPLMTPNHYTELFFLDEATAFAAGHRPCAECQRERFLAFRAAWSAHDRSRLPTAPQIDRQLHGERVGPDRAKRTYVTLLDDLPDGVFVHVPAWGAAAYLILGEALLTWSPGGYQQRLPRPNGVPVAVLTPPSVVRALQAGYVPALHPSVA